jgi:hypothetical protein
VKKNLTSFVTAIIGTREKAIGLVLAGAVSVFCVAAAPAAPTPGASGGERALSGHQDSRQAQLIPVQSADDFGACYTWNRLAPWQEMCNEVTREWCDLHSTITLGSRFVNGGSCPLR